MALSSFRLAMHKFVIPALDLLYERVQKGFSKRQKIVAAVLGLLVVGNFMFRAACPAERRFFVSATSRSLAICAPADVVKNSLPLGKARNATNTPAERRPSLL
jgi:hypothetical protein